MKQQPMASVQKSDEEMTAIVNAVTGWAAACVAFCLAFHVTIMVAVLLSIVHIMMIVFKRQTTIQSSWIFACPVAMVSGTAAAMSAAGIGTAFVTPLSEGWLFATWGLAVLAICATVFAIVEAAPAGTSERASC